MSDDIEAELGEYGDTRTVNPRLYCTDCHSFMYLSWPDHFKRGAFRAECECSLVDPREDHPATWERVSQLIS